MKHTPGFAEDIQWNADEQAKATKLDFIAKNTQHNYKFGIHCGDSPGGPLKMARGRGTLTWVLTETDVSLDITFATDADDGDPEFTTMPFVFLSITNPAAGSGYIHAHMNILVDEDNSDENSCRVTLEIINSPTAGSISYFNWLAIGY